MVNKSKTSVAEAQRSVGVGQGACLTNSEANEDREMGKIRPCRAIETPGKGSTLLQRSFWLPLENRCMIVN